VPELSAGVESITLPFRGWLIELIHLGHGPLRRSGGLVPLEQLRIISLNLARAAVLRGTSPKGYSSLFCSASGAAPVRVDSRPIGADCCFVLGSRAPFDLYLPDSCRVLIVSRPVPGRSRAAFRSLSADHRAVLDRSMRLIDGYWRTATPDDAAATVRSRLNELLEPLAASLIDESADLPEDYHKRSVRTSAVALARKYIQAHVRHPIQLADLCDAAGVGARTLEYGFREHYDVGPMAYLRSVRLCLVRRDLASSKHAGRSVTGAARRWGFRHMGQFSRDYRKLFGEMPSATLARATDIH